MGFQREIRPNRFTYYANTVWPQYRLDNRSQWPENELLILIFYAAAAAKSRQSCPTLCDPIDGSPPGSSIPGIFQARTLEWVAISFSSGSSRPRDRTWLPHCRQNLYFLSHAAAAKSLQSCPTLCDPIDGSPPGSSIPGIFQARVLEWVAIAFSI